MSLIKEDTLFGRIAVLNGIIAESQLNDALAVQKKRTLFSPIAIILMEKGYITKEQFRAILETQKKRLPKPAITPQEKREDMVFAYLAVKNGYADERTIYEALLAQSKFARRGLLFRISEMLINNGYMSLQKAEEILQDQDRRIISCPKCTTQYNTLGLQTPEFPCKKCGFILEVPLELLDTDEPDEIANFHKILEEIAKKEPAISDTTISEPVPRSSVQIITERASGIGRKYSDARGVAETRDEDAMVEDDMELTYGVSETRQEEELLEEEDEYITAGSSKSAKFQLQKYDDETVWYRPIQTDGGTSEDISGDDFIDDEIIAISGVSLAQKYGANRLKKKTEEEEYEALTSQEYQSSGDEDDCVDLIDLAEEEYKPESSQTSRKPDKKNDLSKL